MKRKSKRKRFINPLCCAKCKVNQAALSDAAEQYETKRQEAESFKCSFWKWKHIAKQAEQLLGESEYACELSRSAYEDAQMHASTNHKLLTEAKEEIERLNARCDARGERIDSLKARVAEVEKEWDAACDRIWQNIAEGVRTEGKLKADLAHADMVRRQAERDRDHYKAQMDLQGEKLIEQQTQLKRWGRFDVVSSRLEGDHA